MQLNKQKRERLVEILHNTATSCHDAVAGAWDKSDEGFDALKKAAEEGLEILHAPTPEYVTGAERSFETTVEVCAHRVAVRYWDFDAELTDELEEVLTEHGEERARECIVEGYHSGELNCLYTDAQGEQEEIRGWWEIEND